MAFYSIASTETTGYSAQRDWLQMAGSQLCLLPPVRQELTRPTQGAEPLQRPFFGQREQIHRSLTQAFVPTIPPKLMVPHDHLLLNAMVCSPSGGQFSALSFLGLHDFTDSQPTSRVILHLLLQLFPLLTPYSILPSSVSCHLLVLYSSWLFELFYRVGPPIVH